MTVSENFNPRAPYGARRIELFVTIILSQISIHAPHTGHDVVNAHVPDSGTRFQSTRPIRGTTWNCPPGSGRKKNFNPRAPYGARLEMQDRCARYAEISIHAPHTGHDKLVDKGRAAKAKFQSTRPIRGTTWISGRNACALQISIHAPHTGHDIMGHHVKRQHDISIHAPHTGHDTSCFDLLFDLLPFQSTRPIRGTT